jgi:hypothetical protein
METRQQRQLREARAARDLGSEAGTDAHHMTQDQLRLLGHEPMSPMKAVRVRCLDCCAGSPDEVRKCQAVLCPSWPFRMGTNPWRTISEGRRAAGRRLAAKRAAKSTKLKSDLSLDGGTIPTPIPAPSDEIIAETT